LATAELKAASTPCKVVVVRKNSLIQTPDHLLHRIAIWFADSARKFLLVNRGANNAMHKQPLAPGSASKGKLSEEKRNGR
jgi:hypothetical protein